MNFSYTSFYLKLKEASNYVLSISAHMIIQYENSYKYNRVNMCDNYWQWLPSLRKNIIFKINYNPLDDSLNIDRLTIFIKETVINCIVCGIKSYFFGIFITIHSRLRPLKLYNYIFTNLNNYVF